MLQTQPTPAAGGASALDPTLAQTLAAAAPDTQLTVIVTLRAQAGVTSAGANRADMLTQRRALAVASQTELQSLLATHQRQGAVSRVVPFWIFNGFAVTATPAVIRELAVQPDVLTITPDALPIALAQGGAVEANLTGVAAPALWSLGWRGQGVVVASLDTGVDLSHPELASRWRGGVNSWFDPYSQHAVPADLNGHGTATLGVIVGGSAGGTAIGLAPEARWIAARIFNDRGEATATGVHLAFQWLLDPDGNPATDDAPQVVNNSWTLTAPGCNLAFELDLQALRAAGILPIFAAGNSGPDAATSRSPANNPSAFAVGAVADNDQLYAGSSRGPSACSGGVAHYPHLTAPGVAIRTTARGGGYDDNATGTSLAAPHVAGGLALLLSAFPNLSLAQQETALLASVRDLGQAGPDNDFGAGELDLQAAYQWLLDGGIAPQTGAPITVTTTGDSVNDDGLCSLREAVIAANTDAAVGGCTPGAGGDTIVFANTLTRPVTITLATAGAEEDAALTGDLDISGTLTIDGMTTPGVVAAASADAIVIDGGALDRVIDIQPGAHVTIQGVTLRNGAAVADAGGGLRSRGELTLRHVTISANQGGGLRNAVGSMTLVDVTVTGNTGGFGITNADQGVLAFTDGALRANQGGGLQNQTATASLTRIEIVGNTGGSALVNAGSTPSRLSVIVTTVLSNSTTGSGGGLLNTGTGATTTIDTTRFAYNTAGASGGAIFNSGVLAITASLLDHNQANAGGAIDHASGALTIGNSTLSSNTASDNGGGLYNRGSATARFVTFTDNAAAGAGGNIFNDEGSLALGGVIVAHAATGGNCANSAGFINSIGYNVENTDTCGLHATGDLSNTDPFLGPLQDNSGPTLTHALRIDSPAIDRAPAGVVECGYTISRDQRGITRPLGSGCDAGAYEATSGLGDIVPIYMIQGAGHASPLVGQTVTTRGIVTVLAGDGFYLQSTGDGVLATADAIFVSTNITPAVVPGDDVLVLGQVAEVRPANRADELTVTRLLNPTVTRLSAGNALPPITVIGRSGRVPPSQIIDDDALASFDPASDGLDFYESLEAMRVQIDAAHVVGATTDDRLWVVADDGADAGPRTARGGVLAQVNDANPEVIQLSARLYPADAAWPVVDVGAVLTAPVTGIMDYLDAAYTVHVIAPLVGDVTGQATPETTALTGDALYLTVGALNVNGLSYTDEQAAFDAPATWIAENLGSSDILVLEEVGDNSGGLDDGVVAADQTLGRLSAAVQSAGGPMYSFTQIDPFDAEDGGALGRNARLSILYNPARLQFSARPGDAGTDNSVVCSGGKAALALNPGRIGAVAGDFMDSRKPLAAEFGFDGKTLFVIAVRFDDRTTDSPRFGAIQPPLLTSAARRLAQAQIVHNFVEQILACEPGAKVIVAGNPNDDSFSPAVAALEGMSLTSLLNLLQADAAYSEVSAGVSRVAGQMLVSDGLWRSYPSFDVVHVQAEFAGAPVAQDPMVARITLADITAATYLPLVTK